MKIQVSFVSWCLVGCCRLEGGHRSSYICFNEQPIKRLPISGSPVWRDHGVWWEITFWQIKVWKSIRDSLHFNKKPFKNPYCCSSGCFCPAEKTDAHVWGCPLFTFMSTGVRPKTVLMCDWTLPLTPPHTHVHTPNICGHPKAARFPALSPQSLFFVWSVLWPPNHRLTVRVLSSRNWISLSCSTDTHRHTHTHWAVSRVVRFVFLVCEECVSVSMWTLSVLGGVLISSMCHHNIKAAKCHLNTCERNFTNTQSDRRKQIRTYEVQRDAGWS